jgi:hypothetical protein
MPGAFDDLIPARPRAGAFDDLIPRAPAAPAAPRPWDAPPAAIAAPEVPVEPSTGIQRLGDRLTDLFRSAPVDTSGAMLDRARAGEFREDAATEEGFFDRAGSLLERGAARLDQGLYAAIAGLTGSPRARQAAGDLAAGTTGQDVAGATGLDDLKAAPSMSALGSFIVDAGIESGPALAALAVPYVGPAAVATSQTGNIATARAANDGRTDVTAEDVLAAAPAGALSTFLDRLSLGRMTGAGAAGSGIVQRIGRAAGTEGATEAAQSGIEYAGGTVGTAAGFDPAEAGEQALAGAIAGAPLGGAVRTAVEAPAIAREAMQPINPETAPAPTGAFDDLIPKTPSPADTTAPVSPAAPQPAPEAPLAGEPRSGGLGEVVPVVAEIAPEEITTTPLPVKDNIVETASEEITPPAVPEPTLEADAPITKETPNAAPRTPEGPEGSDARSPAVEAELDVEPAVVERDVDAGELIADTPEAPRKPKGGYEPTFVEASATNRQSVYDSAVRAIGMEPDKFNVLPPARKTRLLQGSVEQLTGIKVETGEDMPHQYAIDQMLDAHQTLQGMAKVLGIEPRALSLKGGLKLKLIKKGRFLGAYAPGSREIILPGRSNSFSHEWAHALDYHLLERLSKATGRGLTGNIRNDGAASSQGVEGAFVKVLNAMFFDGAEIAHKVMELERREATTSSAKQKAAIRREIDNIFTGRSRSHAKSRYWRGADEMNKKAGAGDYWTQPTEMFARAFEAWTAFKMDAEGFGSEFVSKGNDAYLSDAEERFTKTFPKAEERTAIFGAIQDMVDALNAEAMLEASGGKTITAQGATGLAQTGSPEVKAKMAATERKTRGLANRLFGADIEAWKVGRENRLTDADERKLRATDPVKLMSKVNNVRSLAFSAASDGVKMVADRWNSRAARTIHDHFSQDLGGTRHVDRVWDEAITMRENKALNPIFNLLQRLGQSGFVYKKLSAEQRDVLRALLTGKDVADDLGLTPLASAMRKAYNDEWYANQNAGIDLGYVADTAYLNRQTDRELVAGNPDKFREQAAEAYGLAFDRDVGAEGEAIAADPERLGNFLKIAKQGKLDGLKALRKAIRDEADPGKIAGMIDDMLGEARTAFSENAATAYLDAILHTETFPDYVPTSTLPDSEKRRTLPPEADELLKDFYNPDPVSSLLHYVVNSVRRTEWAKRFGPESQIAKKLDEQMAAEGVPESDRRYVWALVDRMSGRYRRTGFLANPAVANALGLLRVKGTLAMMGRAVTLSAFEPAALSIVTGNPIHGLRAVGNTWANVLRKGSRDERMEWARAHGFIKHHMLEQLRMMDRFNTASDTPVKADKLAGWMFRNSGLTFLTNASDAAIVDVGRRGILNEMAHRVARGGSRGTEAANLMRELGIRDPDVFARELVDMRDALPSDEWMNGPMGWDYNTALFRLAKMTIQKPSAADLAPLSRNPLASYATYSITSYIQGAYRHLFKRNAKIVTRLAKGGELGLALRAGGGALAGAALLYNLNLLASIVREMVFNPERQEEWEEDEEWVKNNLALAATRTFSFGALDPFINAWTGLRYNRDISYLGAGAYAGADAQNVGKMVKAFSDQNSPNTNTAERNAIEGLYGFAIAPALAAALSSAPGGPLASAAAGVGTATVTSPQAAKGAATLIAGPKQDKAGEREGSGFDKIVN